MATSVLSPRVSSVQSWTKDVCQYVIFDSTTLLQRACIAWSLWEFQLLSNKDIEFLLPSRTFLNIFHSMTEVRYTRSLITFVWHCNCHRISMVVVDGLGGFSSTLVHLGARKFLLIKINYITFNVWVRYIVCNFNGGLWNSTQNIFVINWKRRFLFRIGKFKSSQIYELVRVFETPPCRCLFDTRTSWWPRPVTGGILKHNDTHRHIVYK